MSPRHRWCSLRDGLRAFCVVVLAVGWDAPASAEIESAGADEVEAQGEVEAQAEADAESNAQVEARAELEVQTEPASEESAGEAILLPAPSQLPGDNAPFVQTWEELDVANDYQEQTLPEPDGTLRLLGATVAPGSTRRLSWSSSDLFEGLSTTTPVLVVNGARPGPTLCLTAAVHGDELNGIEMVRRVVHELDASELAGTVIGVPVVNLHGFRRGSRYLPDRRDLNRYFPGNPNGSSASRIAHAFFTEVVVHCNALVDLHTGSFHRTNMPQLRADLGDPRVVELTGGFGNLVVVHSRAAVGTLRRAAADIGIPAVTMEAGEPMRLQPEEVDHGVQGIRGLLNSMSMVQNRRLFGQRPAIYYSSRWVRADHGGMLLASVQPGDTVRSGQVLGTITDPVTNRVVRIVAPSDGRVIGMALNQVVMPGFAAFHLGLNDREPGGFGRPTDDAELALQRINGLWTHGADPDEGYAGSGESEAEPAPPDEPESDN